MKSHHASSLEDRLLFTKKRLPLFGQFELTYRCFFDCVHCYCRDLEDRSKELSTAEVKTILDALHKEGCLWLTLTGGEPFLREDFLEIYSYAKTKGFLITLFTGCYGLSRHIIKTLASSPPSSIEVTLNGLSAKTHFAVTRKHRALENVKANIRSLAAHKLPLVIKVNCLKENKDEIPLIKEWVEDLLGKPSENKHCFRYDPVIYPRLDGNKAPCSHRLSLDELRVLRRKDPDIFSEYEEYMNCDFPGIKRDRDLLYVCNNWRCQFFIDPYGRLKFCQYSDKFSVDLRKTSFKEGFYRFFPGVAKARFLTDSECRSCPLRDICYSCPSVAFLETGQQEKPVPYFCSMAKQMATQTLRERGAS